MPSLIFCKNGDRTRGASLLEMLIALVIVAITAALAVPSFASWMQTLHVKKAARQALTDLHMARQTAIAENIRYRVVFTASGYTVEREPVLDSNTWTATGVPPQLALPRELNSSTNPYYAKDVTITCSSCTLILRPAGSAEMRTFKFSTGTCTDGEDDCHSRDCERCITTVRTGRMSIAQ